jgi:hypothetical protein
MSRVVFTNRSRTNVGRGSVVTRFTRNAAGESIRIFIMDIRSDSFSENLRYVFGRNVAEARRENIAVTGRADAVIKMR